MLPDDVRTRTDLYLEAFAERAAAHRRGEAVSFTAADLLAAADHVDAVAAA